MNLANLLPLGLSGETALSLATGFGAFLTLIALSRAFTPYDPMTARIKSHARRRAQLRAGLIAAPRRSRQARVSVLRNLVERLKLTQSEDSRKAADQLAQAGLRSRDALIVFISIRLVMPLVCAVGAWLLAQALAGAKVTMLHQLMGAGLGLALGAYGPVLGLKRMIKTRYRKMQKGLPDALDLLVICAEAGLSLDGAMTRVAREMGGAAPELADEFGLAAIELGFLPNRTEALRNLTRRVDLPAIRGVVNTLMQTERYGTPLAQSLRVLAAEFRDQRMMRAEEKAGRLPATLTVPMILFILPTLFIVLIGPALIQVIHTFLH
jgi:tight adherence protein C